MKIRASIRMAKDGTAQVLAKISGMSEERMANFAQDVTVQARENVASLSFVESTGALGREINFSRIGKSHFRIETSSGHASYIEFGTQFIKGQMPFLWPAYRAVKKKFFRMGKWV